MLTLVKGKHVLHMGGEFLDQQINATFWGNVDSGNFTYTGAYTAETQGASNISGLPYADFLLGQTQAWTAANTPEFYPRTKTVQAFVQDDIKVMPNFTVNVGLRWEGWTGMSEAHNNERSWDPTVINPGVDPFGNANTLGAMWYGTRAQSSYRAFVEHISAKSGLLMAGQIELGGAWWTGPVWV